MVGVVVRVVIGIVVMAENERREEEQGRRHGDECEPHRLTQSAPNACGEDQGFHPATSRISFSGARARALWRRR